MHTAPIWAQAVDAAGRFAVTGGADRTVRIWSVADGKLLRTIWIPVGPENVGPIYAVAISPDGSTIAAGGWTEAQQRPSDLYIRPRVRKSHSADSLATCLMHDFLTFSPDGRYLAATLGAGHGLRVFDRDKDWNEAFRDDHYGDHSYGAAFARNGRLATTALDGLIRLYPYDPRPRAQTFTASASRSRRRAEIARPRCFSPDGKRLAVGYVDVAAVDVLDGTTLNRVGGHSPADVKATFGLEEAAWSGDGRTLFAAGGVLDAQGRALLFAWDRGGLGDERRTTYCDSNTAAHSTPCPKDESLLRRRLASASWMPGANRFGPSLRRSSAFAIRRT